YGLDNLKPLSLPMDPNIHLSSAQSPSTTEDIAKMRNIPYHEAVGSLMYAALGHIGKLHCNVANVLANHNIVACPTCYRIRWCLAGTFGAHHGAVRPRRRHSPRLPQRHSLPRRQLDSAS
ncbi:hypothetical protein B0H34DRAFT_658244, partial [Crassisporium funariophilum]